MRREEHYTEINLWVSGYAERYNFFPSKRSCTRREICSRRGEGNQKLFFDNGDQPSGLGGYVVASSVDAHARTLYAQEGRYPPCRPKLQMSHVDAEIGALLRS